MALLAKPDGGSGVALTAHVLVGRSSACTLRVDDTLASGEHARLFYSGAAWIVRDLGSRNGTWLNGARIESGGRRALAAGDRLAFGNRAAVWTLADASPPVAMARRVGDGAMLVAADGMLALPSPEAPTACVVESRGVWIAEIDGEARQVRDGEVIHAEGRPYVLHLPVALGTTDAQGAPATPDEVTLSLRVSQDEEHVEVALAGCGGPRVLAPRSHHYTLLTLARARLRDDASPALAEPQRGWVFVDDLCRSLGIDENRLNVEIYRIRQDFASVGMADATAMVERRRGSRQVRLGTARLAITVME